MLYANDVIWDFIGASGVEYFELPTLFPFLSAGVSAVLYVITILQYVLYHIFWLFQWFAVELCLNE